MRLVKLNIMNLNSLEGEWEVDFDDPEFKRNPLFVISGKMGAGKSTLLDAACLALFRRVPRLGKTLFTKSYNPVMTRGTGECRAELTFEAGGKLWRASYRQHRARRKPDGNLQDFSHSLVDAATGLPAPDAAEDTLSEAERVTGLDFSRFTRCVILPQGRFADFMNSGPDERSLILEKITDTGIYARISARAFQKAQDDAGLVKEAEKRLEDLELVTPEEERALTESLAQASSRALALETEKRLHEDRARLRTEIVAAETRLATRRKESEALEARDRAFAPDRERLARDGLASGLDVPWGLYASARAAADKEAAAMAGLEGRLPAAREAASAAGQAHAESVSRLAAAEGALEAALPAIAEARTLDGRISVARQELNTLTDADADRRKTLARERESLARGEAALEKVLAELAGLRGAIDSGAALDTLAGDLAGIREEAARLGEIWADLDAKKKEGQAFTKTLAKLKEDLGRAEKDLTDKQAALAKASTDLERSRAGRDEALKGRAAEEWQDIHRRESSRHGSLDGAMKAYLDRTEALSSIAERERTVSDASRDMLASEGKAASAQARKTELEANRALAQENLILTKTVVSYEKHRRDLKDGVPCPLCGSTHHPVEVLADARPDLAKERLDGIEAELRDVTESVRSLASETAALRTRRDVAASELPGLRKKEADRLAAVKKLCRDEPLPDPEAGWDAFGGRLAELKDGCAAARDEAEGVLRLFHRLASELEKRQAGHDRAAREEAAAREAMRVAEGLWTQGKETGNRLLGELEALGVQSETRTAALAGRVRPYTAAPVKKGSLDALLKELDARRKEREDLHARHAELSVKCREEQAGLEERRVSVAAREKEADEGRIPIEIARKDAEALSAGRALVIGGRDPDAETARLQGAVSSARETSERMKADAARLQTDLALLEEGLRESGLRAARSLEELAELEARLDAGLIERGFADGAGAPDRAAFLAARLEPDERKRLREAAEAIAGDRTRTASLLEADAQAREAAAAAAEQAGAGTLEEELALAAAVADTLASALADKGRNEERLRASEAAKARAAELVRERDELKARAVRSHALSQLIGSKDGKKFRNYAQGLTLGVLIGNANRQLRAMSGRYVLTEDEAEPLEFAVADGFKGGVERPAKTLSGGETFIVSLALALGLADMTGRDFDLGTLFLDEGFGTLDEDALDAAVGALSELPGTSGKLVGLITHVEALKDRFPQINVVSRQNGRSELAGPGCRRISPGTDNASA